LHISGDGYGSQFRLAISAESLHIADYFADQVGLPGS